jgi:hypothetical protein
VKRIPFGATGETVSEFCLGTMMFGVRCSESEADRVLAAALDRGVNFLDTAAMYAAGRSEEILGRIMNGRRDRLFVATKVHKGLDRGSILSSLDESLARLRTDYVDVYLLHWPLPGMQPGEIMQALAELARAGKTRYVGCANFPAWLVAHMNAVAAANCWPRLVNNQVAYNTITPLVDKITQWQINAGLKWKFSRRFFAEGGLTVGLFTKGFSIYPIAQQDPLSSAPDLKFQNELNDFDVIRSTTTSLYAGMGYRLGQHFDVFANWNHGLDPYLLNEAGPPNADLDSGKRTDFIRGLSLGVRYTL